MKPRSCPRVVVQGSAVFTVNGVTETGEVLDLTVPGCLMKSRLSPKKGDSLTLRVHLAQGTKFRVARGVVRWVEGACFGVEFIEMDEPERVRYNAAVQQLLHRQEARHARASKATYSSQPGGTNWHLD